MADASKVVRRIAEASLLLENIDRLLTNTKNRGEDNFTEPYLKNRLRTLNEYWDKANQLNAEIAFAMPTESRHEYEYFESKVFDVIEAHFEQAETYITNYIDKLHISVYEQPNATSSPMRQGRMEASPQTINLPKLDLPKFSGEYMAWPTFSDSFKAAIHYNMHLSPIQKFQYLKAALSGVALDSISALALTNENYETAWDSLKTHYENNRMVVTALLNKLFSLKPVSSVKLHDLEQLKCDVFSTLEALKNIGVNTTNWDPLVIHLVIQNFDLALRRKWEESLARETSYPPLERLKSFLESRIRPLEAMCLNQERQRISKPNGQRFSSHVASADCRESNVTCAVCQASHSIYTCPTFQSLSPYQRQQKIRELKRCYNCLSHGHAVQQCRSLVRCKTCGQNHHSLLHFEKGTAHLTVTDENEPQENDSLNPELPSEDSQSNLYSHLNQVQSNPVFLATARIQVLSGEGRSLECRALIDPGSQGSFVSETVAQFLRLPKTRANIVVSGVGSGDTEKIKYRTTINISSLVDPKTLIRIKAFILQKITNYHPQGSVNLPEKFFGDLNLADPKFDSSDRIDVLIGADAYGLLLLEGVRTCVNSSLIAQNSKLGWIISGSLQDHTQDQVCTHHLTIDDLDDRLRSFWELESIPSPRYESQEHAHCEQLFRKTTVRDKTGRFIVRLPFKSEEEKAKLGNSFSRAALLFDKLQARLKVNKRLEQHYDEFMNEYKGLGHMSPIYDPDYKSSSFVYLPHHGVIREDKLTTKLRVVVNGSAPTSTGVSLNDVLCAGPKLHNEIPGIILRWRLPRIVVCADIEKMFRQILVNKTDRQYQCILWRSEVDDSVQPYSMNTVTYGTAPAPFLANRVIREIANLCEEEAPLAAKVLKRNIYVDDVLFGSEDQSSLQQIKSQVSSALCKAGFILKKWVSNKPESLTSSEREDWEQLNGENETTKILGICWNPKTDNFILHTSLMEVQARTKREIASSVAACFDPLGWLAPLIIRAKCLLQSLWLIKVAWDEKLPDTILKTWEEFAQDTNEFKDFPLLRWINYSPRCRKLSLVGFCDASYQAYGAVVYIRLEDATDEVTTSLLMAKSRVAPLKTISIPRLELCGALLLTELVVFILENLDIKVDEVLCFTDSQIVLAWLNKQPFNWTSFVANRISQIQTSLPKATWHHVKSRENPADLVSRGVNTQELRGARLWWSGPEWLSSPEFYLKTKAASHEETEVEQRKISSHITTREQPRWELLDKYSSWPKLLRVCAYIQRFVAKLRNEEQVGQGTTLEPHEIEKARIFIFRTLQLDMFSGELRALHGNGNVHRTSKLLSLNPILDENGLLRVGGRLRHAIIPFSERHPILLKADPISDMIIKHCHAKGLHSGLKLTLKLVRESIWLLGARNQVKRVINECSVCIRYRARMAYQMMSDLPPERCNPARPFYYTGLDYAGPFDIRTSSGRGHTSRKGWIALFVCLATKAVHIEVVSDYTTKSFLAALDRMIARRGMPSVIFSDNGTTFQGAESEIRNLVRDISKNADFTNEYSVKGLSWKFIPPAAPHFGGLWEAGVKSLKHHLKRTLHRQTPTYEELTTISCRIESCLNSRPLSPMHDDIDSLEVLTPGHFLIGTSLSSLPHVDSLAKIGPTTSGWKKWHQHLETIWKGWQNDYLNTLQIRGKWQQASLNIRVGDLVLLRVPLSPPGYWPVARVLEVHPGSDERVRVVKLRTSKTTLTRPIHQLCLLHSPAR